MFIVLLIVYVPVRLFRYADPNIRLSTQRGPSQMTSPAVGHPKLAKLEEIILDHFVCFQVLVRRSVDHSQLIDYGTHTRMPDYRPFVQDYLGKLSKH